MHGMWTHRDLLSADPVSARDFYTGLFGWTAREVGPSVWEFEHQRRRVASVRPLEPGTRHGSHWLGTLAVRDCDTAFGRAQEIGASAVRSPEEGPDGRSCRVMGPLGSPVRLVSTDNAEPLPTGPGAFVWMELHTPAPVASLAFYGELVGWRYGEMRLPSGAVYTMARADGGDAAGILESLNRDIPAAWLPYVGVRDVTSAAQRAEDLGGSVVFGPDEIPRVGRFAIVLDSVGAVFAVLGV